MSKRLQVVLDEEEYRAIERVARSHGMTVSEWVRRSLREARSEEPIAEAGEKRAAVRAAVEHEFPTADIDRMLEEIGKGYLGESE